MKKNYRFYNTTYTVFAASIILVYANQEAAGAEMEPLLRLVGMAIEVLETMDECVVALKSARLLQKAMDKARDKVSAGHGHGHGGTGATATMMAPFAAAAPPPPAGDAMLHWKQCWGPVNLLDHEVDLDLALQFTDFESVYQCP